MVRLLYIQIRYLFIFILYILQPITSSAQTTDSFLDTNKVWSTVFWSDATGKKYTLRYKLSGDTIIDNKNFRKVLRNYNEEIPVNWNLYGFIRDDSIMRVFFRRLNFLPDCEYLLYDFNHNVMDTFQIMCFAGGYPHEKIQVSLDSIGTTLISDKPLKSYYISYTEDEYHRVIWIEGIGSLCGFLTNFYPPNYDGLGWYELLCFSENDTIKYINPNYNSCFYTTVVYYKLTEDKPAQVVLFPNPVAEKSELKVTGLKLTNPSIEIFNISGVKLFSKTFDKNYIEINKYKFEPGLYLYRIYDNQKLIFQGKFIVN